MRSKEEAHDYRYFPDPDLVPLEISRARVERLRAALPALPFAALRALHGGVSDSTSKQATQLVDNPPLAAYFDRVVAASSKPAAGDELRARRSLAPGQRERRRRSPSRKVTPEQLAELIALVESKTINSKIAKDVLDAACGTAAARPRRSSRREGLAQTSDPAAVEQFVDERARGQREKRADYRAGKTNVLGFLVGQVMKASAAKPTRSWSTRW